MRRALWLLPLLVVGACKGLFLDAGNAYPCDFSQGPGTRDAVCIPGDVCGSNNVCQKYIYEGPRFEGQATFPHYGPDSGEGAVLHPLVLNSEVSFVTRELPLEARGGSAYVGLSAGIVEDRGFGHLLGDRVELPGAPVVVSDKTIVAAQPFSSGNLGLERSALLSWRSGELSVGTLNRVGPPGLSTLVRNGANNPIFPVGARVLPLPTPTREVLEGLPVVWTATDIGFLQESANWRYLPVPIDAGSVVVDVAGLAQPGQLWLVVMTRDTLFIGDVDAGTLRQTDTMSALTAPLVADHDALRTDRNVRIVGAVRRGLLGPGDPGEVLSTFQVTLGPMGPELVRTWPDCRPCSQGQRLDVFAPTIATGFPAVEVACVGVGPNSSQALRVVGSVALTQGEDCVTENLDLPLATARLARDGANRFVQWNSQSGLRLGGKDGQVWTGETLSDLLPLYLDRVPRDVTAITMPSGERLLVAITNDSFMVQQTPTSVGAGEAVNGFHRFDPDEPLIPRLPRLLRFIRGGEGWAVTAKGEVDQAAFTDAGPRVTRGPVLVTASEDPIRDSIGGEAFTTADAGVSLFIAADDSLYFVDQSLLVQQGDPDLLTPDLTPEPSVPIRSLALERTPLGTDGDTRARGYLVTSRNVYSWQLGGNPRRWSSTPLVLAGGEPVEVWFDQPRSALGRVGYADGQIYTLPGGYELAEPLPEDEDGVPPRVLDYENLGGWPVAYANTGLFIAGWDEVGGKLQNRFPDGGINRPMSWRKVTLPDGGHPWMRGREAKPGSLFVKTDAPVPDPNDTSTTLKPYRLLLFLDDQVLQLASHLRK
jgi:hypothetical protein